MLVIRKEDESFVLYENGTRVGVCKKTNYPKDAKFGYIWKLPQNSAMRDWVSAGKMADGLTLEAHKEKVGGSSTKAEKVDSMVESATKYLNDEELSMFLGLLNKITKGRELEAAKQEYEAALAKYEAMKKGE